MLDGAKKIHRREREWRRWRVLISNATFSISNMYSVGLSLSLFYVTYRPDRTMAVYMANVGVEGDREEVE